MGCVASTIEGEIELNDNNDNDDNDDNHDNNDNGNDNNNNIINISGRSATQTTYGENGFSMYGGNTGLHGTFVDDEGTIIGVFDSWTSHGNMGHLGANQKDLAIGGTYAMGDFNLGATMHQITNDVSLVDDRDVTEIALGYTMSDNANLSISMATDKVGDADDVQWMWITLNIRP
jgi:hypothetical protein